MSQDKQHHSGKKPTPEKEAASVDAADEAPDRRATQTEKTKDQYQKIQLRFNRLLTWFTAGLFLTSVIAGGISYYQARIAKQSADTATDSLVSVQRAFVTLSTFTNTPIPSPKPKVGNTWFLEAIWQNLGTTPARVIVHRFSVRQSTEEPDGEVFRGQAENFSVESSVIGPKATLSVGPVAVPESSVLPNAPKAIRGTYTIAVEKRTYFWGWIAYRDVFPKTKPHLSEFCYRLDAVFLGRDPATGATMQFKNIGCKKHNCTDEDCQDYDEILAMLPK